MTTYTHTGDIRTSNDSDTQNGVTTDTVSVTINTRYGATIQSSFNCQAYISSSNGSSYSSTHALTVTFSNTGNYSVVVSQSFGSRTYTLSGTTSTPPAYGVEIFDTSGTKVLSITDRVNRFVANGSFTISSGDTSKDITVTGMTNTDKFQVFLTPTGGDSVFPSVSKSTNKFTCTIPQQASDTTFSYLVMAS